MVVELIIVIPLRWEIEMVVVNAGCGVKVEGGW